MSSTTSRRIFVSYRREDTRHMAGRLFDRLAERFGDVNVFMDVDSIEPGVDFAEAIERAVGQSDVLLTLIGAAWLCETDEHGRRRLDDPDDLVVLEVKSALNRGIRVIPVLVDGAAPPRRDDLPECLAPLARRNAVRLDHDTFRSDIGPLLAVLDRTQPNLSTAPPSRATISLEQPSETDVQPYPTGQDTNQDVELDLTAGSVGSSELQPSSRGQPPTDPQAGPDRAPLIESPDHALSVASAHADRAASAGRDPSAVTPTTGPTGSYDRQQRLDEAARSVGSAVTIETAVAGSTTRGRPTAPHNPVEAAHSDTHTEPVSSPEQDHLQSSPPPRSSSPSAATDVPSRRPIVGVLIAVTAVGLLLIVVMVFTPSRSPSSRSDNPTQPTDGLTVQPVQERTITGQGKVYAVATAQLNGRPVIVSGGNDETVRVWDVASGQPIGHPLVGHEQAVGTVATAELAGRLVIVSGDGHYTVRVWDLSSGAPIGQPIAQKFNSSVVTTTQLGDRPVIVSGGIETPPVRVWDLSDGTPVGQPSTCHSTSVHDLAIAQLDGRPVIVSGDSDGIVCVSDPATGEPVGQPFAVDTKGVSALTTVQLDGRPVIISAGSDNNIRLWDLATRTPIGQPLTGHTESVAALAIAELHGRQVLVSASSDDTLRVWDLAARTPITRPLTGHTDNVVAVATTQLNGRPVIISGSTDGTLRTWDLAAHINT